VSVTSLRRSPPALRRPSDDDEPDWSAVAAVAAGLEAALETRAPSVHAGTPLVRKLAAQVSRLLGLDEDERLAIDICARVRDIGMIGLPDHVLANADVLSAGDQAVLNRHPAIGAALLQSLSTMAAVAASVRAHHERWDGAGYPDGLRGEAIPLPSRVVAVCDAFVVVATDRPPRRGIGAEGALDFIRRHRGSQFDPCIADCLVDAVSGRGRPRHAAPAPAVDRAAEDGQHAAHRAPGSVRDLRTALGRFSVVPAFAPACEQALAAPDAPGPDGRRALVKAVEGDIGLTVAVLRRAQPRGGQTGIANVANAIAVLTRDEIDTTIATLPRASFPWHNAFDALLMRSRLHAQAVARVVERLAYMTKPFDTEDLVAAALLHDIGRLVLARARADYIAPLAAGRTPEERARDELRELGVDHASLGGLLLERWGLPEGLVDAVARHHRSRPDSELAALVRLGDMVAHHSQGDAVDLEAMFRLAADWDLPAHALRDIVFDQPQLIATRRCRIERSPLSTRETEILRLVAEGRRDAEIARALTLSVSTVRTHLHNVHAKLKVPTRAQAVLRASEMAWI
jgi:putative nucleotidyltransferase with HDIG domain